MKKKILTAVILISSFFVFSNDILKIKDVRAKIATMRSDGIQIYINELIDKKVEKETGWIVSIKRYDETSDIVMVELDKPNMKNLVPDLSFIIDKKISKKLSDMQMLYLYGTILNYDSDMKIIEIKDVFLSGIMK